MRLRVRATNVSVAPEVLAAIERTLRFALSRFSASVAAAHVTLSSSAQDGRAGSSRCRLRIRLHDGAPLVIEDGAEDLQTAASRVVWRLGHRWRQLYAREPSWRGTGRTIP